MNNGKPFLLSLTGEGSHKVKIPDGQGSFSIGTKGISPGKYDALVEIEAKINWPAFEECISGGAYVWPRFFYYSGNDTSFATWSINRRIESFSWMPFVNATLDTTESHISKLHLHSRGNTVHLALGLHIRELCLSGDLSAFSFSGVSHLQKLTYSLSSEWALEDKHCLPLFPIFNELLHLDIENSAIGKPFDCLSLLRYPNLESINLSGHLINLEALGDLKHLRYIGIRNAPNIQGFPSLYSWRRLDSFIAWIVEEQEGKRLQKELKELQAQKEMKYSNVSKLKKKNWFLTEYSSPFKGWEGKNEKAATKKYKDSLKSIAKAKDEDQVKVVLIDFIQFFNGLENIETIEREDIGQAVSLLAKVCPTIVTEEQAEFWFDSYKDY